MADYRVAVELTLVGGLAQALAAITSHMMGIRTHQRAIAEGFRSWRPALLGVVSIFAGGVIVKGLYDIASAADKSVNELVRMTMQGQKAADVAKNWQEAVRVGLKTGRPIEGVLAEMGKVSYYTGDTVEARALAEKLAKMETVLHAVTGKSVEGQITPLLKVLEEVGILGNPERQADLDKLINELTKDITATKGAVSPAQIGQNILYMRAARFGITSPEALKDPAPFVTTILPYLIQSFGGMGRGGQAGPGAALMSMFTKNVQGILSKGSRREAAQLGLMEGGRKFGHLKGADEYALNPYKWVQDVLMPALTEKGITSQAGIIQHLSKLYGTRAAADPAIAMSLLGPKRFEQLGLSPAMAKYVSPMERHIRAQQRAQGLEEAFESAWKMPTMLKEKIANEWTNLWTIVGAALNQPALVPALAGVGTFLENLGTAASKVDPSTIQGIAGVLGGLAAGLASLGSIAVFGTLLRMAGPLGLLASVGIGLISMSEKVHQAIADLGKALATGDMDKIKSAGAALASACVNAVVDGLTSLMALAIARIRQVISDGLDKTMQAIYGISRPAISFGTGMGATQIPQSMAPWHWDHPHFRHHRPGERTSAESDTRDKVLGPIEAFPNWLDEFFRRFYGVPNQSPPSSGVAPPSALTPLPFDFGGNIPGPGLRAAPSIAVPSSAGPSLLRRQSWEPGGGGVDSQQINNVIYLDGAAIARAVHDYSASDMAHPRQAAQFDGRANMTTPDMQTMTV